MMTNIVDKQTDGLSEHYMAPILKWYAGCFLWLFQFHVSISYSWVLILGFIALHVNNCLLGFICLVNHVIFCCIHVIARYSFILKLIYNLQV
jgi:hypothetical protein